MSSIKLFEEFINEGLLNENVGGLLPNEDYPIYIAVRPDKVGNNYMASAVLPERDASDKYQPMAYVLEELRKHYKMSKGDFPTNKTVYDRSRMKSMDVDGTSIKLNWGPQNRGYQIMNLYSPDKRELEDITELIANFAKI
jgi:hypothetical protein